MLFLLINGKIRVYGNWKEVSAYVSIGHYPIYSCIVVFYLLDRCLGSRFEACLLGFGSLWGISSFACFILAYSLYF